MDGLENYKAKLHALGELMKKMEAGSLSISELSDLETLTRELHERSIILKYKAFEAKVNQETPIKKEIQVVAEVIEEEAPIVEELKGEHQGQHGVEGQVRGQGQVYEQAAQGFVDRLAEAIEKLTKSWGFCKRRAQS